MKGDWFNAFKSAHNLEFTKEDYAGWKEMTAQSIAIYLKYLPEGHSLLDCCCGMGCTAIPLSHHYEVTAFDKDERILGYTRTNAERFGSGIKVVNADFRQIDKVFGHDSFDASTSEGVLEHYWIDEVRDFVNKQLIVAPLVFVSIPLGNGVKTVDSYGITRHNYTKQHWLEEILKDYFIVEHSISQSHTKVSGDRGYKELLMVVKRK